MVFIGGPRQVGKTTLAKYIGRENSMYLNWDNPIHRMKIIKLQFLSDSGILIFDEIHKYKKWKNYVKGIYDTYDKYKILVTGSARLNLYRKGEDSLQGRYHYYRLHPFSVAELPNTKRYFKPFSEIEFVDDSKIYKNFDELLVFGGFPEPFFDKDKQILRRWHNERVDRLIKEDIRDIEMIRDLSALQILVEILPDKVGSLLSLNNLRQDLEVAHKTISLWMDILEKFYFHYRIYPFRSSLIKSLRKEPKMFLWDWSRVENPGAKLENVVASHLLKFVHYYYDFLGYKTELHYLRDINGNEVDFIVISNKKPWFAVEVKTSDTKPSKNLKYFTRKLKIPYSYQLVYNKNIDIMQDNIRVMSVPKFLSGLV